MGIAVPDAFHVNPILGPNAPKGPIRVAPGFKGPTAGGVQGGPALRTGNFGQAPTTLPGATVGHPAAPGAPVSPPLDATYYMNVARNGFNTGNQVNALNLSDTNAGIALQNALGALQYQEPRDELKLEQGVNNRGALYSSVGDQQQSDLANSYQSRQATDTSNYQGTTSADQAKIAALQGGIPLYNADQALASSQRASAAAQKNPSFGLKTATKTKAAPLKLHFSIK